MVEPKSNSDTLIGELAKEMYEDSDVFLFLSKKEILELVNRIVLSTKGQPGRSPVFMNADDATLVLSMLSVCTMYFEQNYDEILGKTKQQLAKFNHEKEDTNEGD